MTNHSPETEADPALVGEAFELVGVREIWRANILYAGVELGLFECIDDTPTAGEAVADELGTDPEYTFRLLRALAHYDLFAEDEDGRFTITSLGELFRADHPQSVSHAVRLFRSPEMRRVWLQLPDVVAEGGTTGWVQEFGERSFDYMAHEPELAEAFNGTMTVFSQIQAPQIVATLDEYDFSEFSHLCDIGGSHGYMLCLFLQANPHLEGSVLELPKVVDEEERHWAPKLGVADRCTYIAGDMFESVPEADGYLIKSVLHDWSDDECIDILETIGENAPADGRLFIVEPLMPPPGTIDDTNVRGHHRTIPSDINMMVGAGGRERTLSEFRSLLEESGWEYVKTWEPAEGSFHVIEALTQR